MQQSLDNSEHYYYSSYREKILEHLFVGELLKALWLVGIRDVEVLFADVDAAGYDIIFEAKGIIRHVQLKSSFLGSKTSRQPVNKRLSAKPNGCVVWIYFDALSLRIGPFYWFGAEPKMGFPNIENERKAKHTKANSEGKKEFRKNTIELTKSRFQLVEDIGELAKIMFGYSTEANNE